MSKNNNYKVYVHINKINGKRYYGITCQKVERRWANGKGYKDNQYFTRAINKYGWDNFEHIVIAKGLTEAEAKWLEIELIKEFDTTNRDKGYNITLGGESLNGYKMTEEHRKKISEGNKGKTLSEEHKKKLSESHKGKTPWNKGKPCTEETRKKLSEANKKYKPTEETKQKISEASKKMWQNEEHRKKISEANKKMWQNEELRKKISEANKGKTMSEEAKKKISEANKGENNGMYGKTHTKETRKKLSESLKGHEVSEETRKKIGEARKGKTHTEEAKKKISEACKGKNTGKNNNKATEIYCVELDKYFDTINEASEFIGCSKNSISSVVRGKSKTAGGYHWLYANEVNEENINRVMSKEYNINGHARKIYCVELDIYFDTITEASKIIGCARQGISKVLNGKYKTYGGYHWVYAEDVEKIDIENKEVS